MEQFKEKITPHLQKLITNGSKAIGKQFVCDEKKYEGEINFSSDDPLNEEKFMPVKSIVHKYNNRILWKISYECAAHCRFCTRRRQVGNMK